MELQSKRSMLTQEALENGINRIKIASHRIRKVIGAMKTLNRKEHGDEMVFYSIDKLLSEVLFLCHEKSILAEVKISVANNLQEKEILCLPTELGQVLINMINNSFYAIAELEEKFIKIDMHELDGSIVISIIDSGKGIPLEVEKKIFDPFFSTKPVGKGAGIGMSISKKIVELHQGTIRVDRKSMYTKIDIILPIFNRG